MLDDDFEDMDVYLERDHLLTTEDGQCDVYSRIIEDDDFKEVMYDIMEAGQPSEKQALRFFQRIKEQIEHTAMQIVEGE